jgi:xanthine dehydrogenase YagT iron-sulfur-binding subunit
MDSSREWNESPELLPCEQFPQIKSGSLDPQGQMAAPLVSRREFVGTVGAVATGVALGHGGIVTQTTDVAETQSIGGSGAIATEIVINGQKHQYSLDPRITLLDLLREHAGLTGTKKGCDHGQCGACTVLSNGIRINSCLTLAVTHDGDEITTVEGIANGDDLHPVQAEFLEHDGLQCGYCTPGQICSAVALLREVHNGDVSFVTADLRKIGSIELDDDEIRERMSGNICRCGAYPSIVAAVRAASRTSRNDVGGTR